jgi:hypothetical protein
MTPWQPQVAEIIEDLESDVALIADIESGQVKLLKKVADDGETDETAATLQRTKRSVKLLNRLLDLYTANLPDGP